jgi:hypothetical protein
MILNYIKDIFMEKMAQIHQILKNKMNIQIAIFLR